MAISETKMQMVLANYFKDECDVNTSIRQAFEKGFRIGVKKGASTDRPPGKWIRDRYWSRGVGMGEEYGFFYKCSMCEYEVESGYTRCGFNFCPYCGADMRKGADDDI